MEDYMTLKNNLHPQIFEEYENELLDELVKGKNPCFSHYINWRNNKENLVLIFDDISWGLHRDESKYEAISITHLLSSGE